MSGASPPSGWSQVNLKVCDDGVQQGFHKGHRQPHERGGNDKRPGWEEVVVTLLEVHWKTVNLQHRLSMYTSHQPDMICVYINQQTVLSSIHRCKAGVVKSSDDCVMTLRDHDLKGFNLQRGVSSVDGRPQCPAVLADANNAPLSSRVQ